MASVALLAAKFTNAITLQATTNPQDLELISDNMSEVDFMSYYKNLEGFDDDNFDVNKIYMRRDANFMQGFYYDMTRKQFVESAGLYGVSKVEWLIEAGDDEGVLEQDPSTDVYDLAAKDFGEGLSPLNADEFIDLTWHERKMIILDRNTLEYKREYVMPDAIKEGWGVTAIENSG